MVCVMAGAQGLVRLTVYVGSTQDRSRVPVEIHLTNEVEISGIAGYLFHPAGSRFVDPNNIGNGEVACTTNTSRCGQSHKLDYASDKKEQNGLDRLFFTFLSGQNEPLKKNSGHVITLYLDCSELEDGDYQIFPLNMEGIGTNFASHIFEEESVPAEFKLSDDVEFITTNAAGSATHVSEHELDFASSGLKAYVATEVSETHVYLSFGGMTVKEDDSVFTLGEDGLFHRLPADYEIPEDMVYLMVPWETKAEVLIPWVGDPTGVKNIPTEEQIRRAYNLLGQKVRTDAKGVVIINGKKVKR